MSERNYLGISISRTDMEKPDGSRAKIEIVSFPAGWKHPMIVAGTIAKIGRTASWLYFAYLVWTR